MIPSLRQCILNVLAAWIFVVFLSAPGILAQQKTSPLSGTQWKLVQFTGGDDTHLLPAGQSKYTLDFHADGTVNAQVDCNRGRSHWTSTGKNDLTLAPFMLTRAMCPHAPLNNRIPKDWEHVRSYVVKDGHLYLNLMADGGTYEFTPAITPVSQGGAKDAPLQKTVWDLARIGDDALKEGATPKVPHLVFDPTTFRVTGNGGCNQFSGSYALDNDKLHVKGVMGTMMACIGDMSIEHKFLRTLPQVSQWKVQGNDLTLFDKEARPILYFHAHDAK